MKASRYLAVGHCNLSKVEMAIKVSLQKAKRSHQINSSFKVVEQEDEAGLVNLPVHALKVPPSRRGEPGVDRGVEAGGRGQVSQYTPAGPGKPLGSTFSCGRTSITDTRLH